MMCFKIIIKCLHRRGVFKPNCGSLKDESIERCFQTKSEATHSYTHTCYLRKWMRKRKKQTVKKKICKTRFYKNKSQKSRSYTNAYEQRAHISVYTSSLSRSQHEWIGNVYLNGRIFFSYYFGSVFFLLLLLSTFVCEKAMHLWVNTPFQVVYERL